MVMDFDRAAVLISAGDAPLRAAECELSGHGCVVDNNVHMRLQPDIAGHGFPNASRTARYFAGAVDLVQSDYGRFGMVHRGRSLDVMRVESSRKPEIHQFW
jgi:hypothetical protein